MISCLKNWEAIVSFLVACVVKITQVFLWGCCFISSFGAGVMLTNKFWNLKRKIWSLGKSEKNGLAKICKAFMEWNNFLLQISKVWEVMNMVCRVDMFFNASISDYRKLKKPFFRFFIIFSSWRPKTFHCDIKSHFVRLDKTYFFGLPCEFGNLEYEGLRSWKIIFLTR